MVEDWSQNIPDYIKRVSDGDSQARLERSTISLVPSVVPTAWCVGELGSILLDHGTAPFITLGRPSLSTVPPKRGVVLSAAPRAWDGSAHALAFSVCDLCSGQEACH